MGSTREATKPMPPRRPQGPLTRPGRRDGGRDDQGRPLGWQSGHRTHGSRPAALRADSHRAGAVRAPPPWAPPRLRPPDGRRARWLAASLPAAPDASASESGRPPSSPRWWLGGEGRTPQQPRAAIGAQVLLERGIWRYPAEPHPTPRVKGRSQVPRGACGGLGLCFGRGTRPPRDRMSVATPDD